MCSRSRTRALKGIDPATLTPNELGEVLSGAMATTRSDGLAWASCYVAVTGMLVLVATAVVAVVAIVNSKCSIKTALRASICNY